MTRKTAWITTVDAKDAERELAELYDQVRDPQTGLLDHIMTIHSLHPKGLDAHFRLYAASMTGTRSLPKVDREMIALVVSRINECHY
jgi:alkylhydroperoxidase family enzyme